MASRRAVMRKTDSRQAKPQESELVRISVSDFGPIADGVVELRPLTIFVGPSNAGKTYFATLIYSLHRTLSGFKSPISPHWSHPYRFYVPTIPKTLSESDKDQIFTFIKVLFGRTRQVKWSYLPDIISQELTDTFGGAGIEDELSRCFDLTDLNQLIYTHSTLRRAKISVTVRNHLLDNWKIKFRIGEDQFSTSTDIEDLFLFTNRRFRSRSLNRLIRDFGKLENASKHFDELTQRFGLSEFLEHFSFEMQSSFQQLEPRSIHYLPAARSGIMQSHRVIASSLVSRSTRAGVEQFREIPTFSGPLADFMERLLLFKQRSKNQARFQQFEEIAESLELETLAGRIVGRSVVPGTYPEFVYRPSSATSDIRLSRASSMVSELAPIVLFLRGVVSLNSTVVIEEPEAHLHPAAQAQIAKTLARMVRAGLRVVVTTHSDWLLKEIANLLREGLLEGRGCRESKNAPISKFLRRSEVGVWLFRRSDGGSIVEEIPFNTSESLEPQEYEDVEEELYNRAASLQNRLEEENRR